MTTIKKQNAFFYPIHYNIHVIFFSFTWERLRQFNLAINVVIIEKLRRLSNFSFPNFYSLAIFPTPLQKCLEQRYMYRSFIDNACILFRRSQGETKTMPCYSHHPQRWHRRRAATGPRTPPRGHLPPPATGASGHSETRRESWIHPYDCVCETCVR